MTVAFAFAESILGGLTKLSGFDLPIALVSSVRRVLRKFKTETEDLYKDREKILTKYCTLDSENKKWVFPKSDSANYQEFMARWEELHQVNVIFPYEPIDYLGIIDSAPVEIKKNIIAKGDDFNIIDELNETYNYQFNKKETPPATVVSDKGKELPNADA
jgi:hypothetical protein